jgi:hypothetical protein
MPVLGDADYNRHVLAVPGDNLRSISLDRPDELAEALLGFLQLPAIVHRNLHLYLDSLDRNGYRFSDSTGVPATPPTALPHAPV